MSDHEASAVKAAQDLLNNRPRHRTEGNVQSDIEALLRTLNVGTIESKYQIGSDQADIYLPNRRAFLEVKAYPKAADPEVPQDRSTHESPREQLDRYVLAEIQRERTMLPGLSELHPDVPWTGIVTDGSNWTVYRYPNEVGAKGTPVTQELFFNEGEPLAAFLADCLGTEMVGKEWVPKRPGAIFTDLKSELDELYGELPRKAVKATDTKRRLWLDMMLTSGMIPSDEAGRHRLFLAHSFLIVVVRLVSHSLTGPTGDWQSALHDGFAAWVLDFSRGRRWAGRVQELVDGYDWRKRRGDVLRDLYHEYVDERDRKVFGEFYTPDWLAAMMVEEVLDEEWIEHSVEAALSESVTGIGVLDPACGSGTFLYHAALRLIESPSVRGLRPVQRSNVAASLINGMDIHPVAVEVARVNLQRAFPAEPTQGASAFRVFLGDSLQTAAQEGLIFGHNDREVRLATPRGNQASIPMALVRSPSFAEDMRRMVNAALEDGPVPAGIAGEQAELETCLAQLGRIIADEGNSVWTWYAVNLAGPHLLAERKIDRIVANPPWVKLSDIQVEGRKRAMEALGEHLGLQSGGKQAPHLDIASYFILRARSLYMADPEQNAASWLVKKSALRSGQWAPFRRLHGPTLSQSLDLEDLAPFGWGDATRCCVLMERRRISQNDAPRLVARLKTAGSRPASHDLLDAARARFALEEAPVPLPQAPSGYPLENIRNGATIMPHVLALVSETWPARRHGWMGVETSVSAKPPWREVPSQTGEVPKTWVRPILMSRDMLSFTFARDAANAIIPVGAHGEVLDNPGRACPFWRELDEIYDAHQGSGRNTPSTLIEQYDFAGKLSSQPLEPQRGRRMVLYPKSANIMRAARYQPGSAVVHNSLYWISVRNEAEAGYLVAVLNAACLRRAFVECRDSGRDFHLHPWRRVPIPIYDASNPDHRRLATLCASAERVARRCVDETLADRPALGQQGLSDAIRTALAESQAGQEVEEIVARVLPDQAQPL